MRTVLRRPDFRLLFAGLVASMIGESILLLAMAIWVKDLTGSNGLAGVTILAIVAPMTLAPLVGWVVDRFRRQPFLVAANLVTAAVLVPLFFVQGRGSLWLIYTVAVAYGLSYIAVGGALTGLIKLIVPEELLPDANGALQTVRQGLRLIGPLVGAGVYTSVGGWLVAAIAILGFAGAAGAVAAMRVREDRPVRGELRWRSEAGAGVRHLVAEPALRRTVAGVATACLLVGFTESLIFAYVDDGLHRSPAFVGVLSTPQGVGGLLGGLLAARVVRRLGEVGAAAAGIVAFAVGCGSLAYPRLWLGIVGLAMAGLGLPVVVVSFSTLLQRVTPAALMGRAATAADALISGPQAVSIALGAVLVSIVDYRLMFLAMGVGLAAAGGYLWAGRSLSAPPAAPAPVKAEPVKAEEARSAAPQGAAVGSGEPAPFAVPGEL